MSQEVPQERLTQLWAKVVEEIKKGDVNIPLWGAMDCAVPLAFEEPLLVLGMIAEDFHRSGHLKTAINSRNIRQVLEKLTSKKVELEVVEGTELRHWELEKTRRAEREDALRRQFERSKAEVAGGLLNWDDVGVALQHKFQDTKDRNLPWVQAKYMEEAFELIADLEDRQRAEPNADHHLIDRGVARTLQKVSGQLENLHITVLGIEYRRFRQELGG